MDSLNPIRISLVIPAYNEANYLPRLLDSVEIAKANFPPGAGAIEVIVADNSSTDSTAEIARSRGCRVVHVEKRLIGAARNGGARAAQGKILAFCDADMRIHPQTFNAIEEAIERGGVVGGATGVSLERISIGIGATYLTFLPMVWLTGFDTGVVFCRREDFVRIGGYSEQRLYAEDVQFMTALWRLGRRTGRRLTRLRSQKAIVSMRKFDKHGDWHQLKYMLLYIPQVLFSAKAADRFARSYWYDDRR